MSDSKFKFGEWLPDQPDLDNAGLTEAKNVIFSGGSYGPYSPFTATGALVNGLKAVSAFRAYGLAGGVSGYLYAGSTDNSQSYLQMASGGVLSSFTNVTTAGGLSASDTWSFAQLNNTVIATNGVDKPQYNPLSVTAFSKLTGAYGDAPIAKVVATFNQFVILGNLKSIGAGAGQNYLQWSGINAPFDWPTPNSAQAIAEQSGQQYLDNDLGAIEGIANGDQWAIVMTDAGIVRMTYLGYGQVLQFDTIYRAPALIGPNAWAKVGGKVFMLNTAGALYTDGARVESLGDRRINKWLSTHADFNYPNQFSAGVDNRAKVIYWTFPAIGNAGVPNAWIAYNYLEDRWTHGVDSIQTYVRGEEAWISGQNNNLEAFGTSRAVGTLSGSVGTASIITGEAELNPGGKTLVLGLLPQITGTTLANIACKVSSRNNQTDAVATTAGSTPDSFTGSSNLIVDARYHRAEFDITGSFGQAIGGEFDAQPSSSF